MTLEEYRNQQHEIDLVVFHGIFKTQNSRSMRCHVEDVCRRMLIFSRKVLKDRVERTGRSRQADVAMDGNWSRARTD